MARSAVVLETLVEDVRRETGILTDFNDFPDPLLYKWVHQAVCDTVLKLGGLINNLYRKLSGTLTVTNQVADMSSLLMIHYPEPFWQVLDDSDDSAIEQIPLERARWISTIPSYNAKVYWYQVGQDIMIALGDGGSAPANIAVGYYELPTEADAAAELIDIPEEYHDLIRQKVVVTILREKGEAQGAAQKEADLTRAWAAITQSQLGIREIDRRTGERD